MHAAAKSLFCALPPLILHPFADPAGSTKLLETSRISLMLQGLAPAVAEQRELERRLLEGRFCEIRMLFYVGKDVNRWIDQCMEIVQRMPELGSLSRQTFADLLIENTPDGVRQKLSSWGVSDYRAIFTRGLGLNAVFAEVPARETLNDDFVRDYYRYADRMFQSRYSAPAPDRQAITFHFDLYASSEYSRMLEQEWGTDVGDAV